MQIIDIVGENYAGKWEQTRTACRGIVLRDGKLLLSYETVTGQWMLPGGGLEGILIRPSECLLEIDEYYENWKWISRYFSGEVTGMTAVKLTGREKQVGMEPRWLPVDEIVDIFSRHADYTDTDEMRRGMYLREYTALKALLKKE